VQLRDLRLLWLRVLLLQRQGWWLSLHLLAQLARRPVGRQQQAVEIIRCEKGAM
jgi:hypothetical protein